MKIYIITSAACVLLLSNGIYAGFGKKGTDTISKTIVNKLGDAIDFSFNNPKTKTNLKETVRSDTTKSVKMKRDDEGELKNKMKIAIDGRPQEIHIDKDFSQTNDYIFVYAKNDEIRVTTYSEAGYAAKKTMKAASTGAKYTAMAGQAWGSGVAAGGGGYTGGY